MRVMLCFLALVVIGCASKPFMGVPDDHSRTLGGDNPRARDIVTITPVATCEYGDYLKFKQEGSVFREEHRGPWLYFAVRKWEPVYENPNAAGHIRTEMIVWVSQRFKTRVRGETKKERRTSQST